MKLFIQIAVLATFMASMAAAVDNAPVLRERQLGYKKSKSFSLDDTNLGNDAKGEMGCRMECSDKRFTMVCEWEANKKKKKYYKSRRLADGSNGALDFDDEHEEKEHEQRELATVVDENGRRLGVELDHVECILGVGKKDSDDSSEDYEEYKERLKFPDDKWTIKIWKAKEFVPVNCREAADGHYYHKDGTICDAAKVDLDDYYKFNRKIVFEDIEDPNNSGDEITITGEIEIELKCDDGDAAKAIYGHEGLLYVDDEDLKFSC